MTKTAYTVRLSALHLFDWVLIAGVVVSGVLYSLLSNQWDAMGLAAAVSGVVCVVLAARRSIYNYLFGLVNVTLYAVIAYRSQIYGDAVLNAFYYLPMQFAGFFLWRRRAESGDAATVRSRQMSRTMRLAGAVVVVVVVGATGWLLGRFTSDPQPYKDAATTVLSVMAQYLMVKAFMEQWALWIVVNAISLTMWIVCTARGDAHAALMVVMWTLYLANSVNGFVVWKRSAAKDKVLKGGDMVETKTD